MSIINAQTLSEAIQRLPGHSLREVCATPCGVVLTGTIFADTSLAGQDSGALVTVSITNTKWIELCRLQQIPPFPSVVCHESWIVRNIDWHAFGDGKLCWELPLKWRDQIHLIHRLKPDAVAEFAALYFLNSTAWLIGRHRLQHIFNLPKWRDDWRQWGHGKDGLNQYLHERRGRR